MCGRRQKFYIHELTSGEVWEMKQGEFYSCSNPVKADGLVKGEEDFDYNKIADK